MKIFKGTPFTNIFFYLKTWEEVEKRESESTLGFCVGVEHVVVISWALAAVLVDVILVTVAVVLVVLVVLAVTIQLSIFCCLTFSFGLSIVLVSLTLNVFFFHYFLLVY